jgi:hypothetical protein
MDEFGAKLASLGFELPKWQLPPSEALVVEFEKRFTLTLPSDYRCFLVRCGGFWSGDGAVCPFLEPTPCGDSAFIQTFFGFTEPTRSDNIIDATEMIDGYPDVIAIGDNTMGGMLWLKCAGNDAGYVYMFDNQYRSTWPDEHFFQMFPNIAPEIRKYLELRRQRKLPSKAKGYDHVYLVSKSFTEFMSRLVVDDEGRFA